MALELKMPSDARGKRLVLLAAISVLGVGAYWYLMWKPDHAEVLTIAAHADTLEAQNAIDKKLVENGEGERIKAASERYTAELAALRRLVPTQNEVPALIEAISTAARQTGMEVGDIAPDGILPGDYFDAQKFKFSVTGPYHKIAEFFTSIGSLDRIMVPINVTIANSGRKIERKPGKDEVFVDASFGVLTYVAKTIALPPAPTKP
jgi:type IV pilus assembly protein PilO